MKRKICVVGAGRWGKNHIKTLAKLDALGGIVEADRETLEALGKQYPGVQLFGEVTKALAADFDGYTVATPAETHFAIAREILTACKPVLVEKPIALTATEARQLEALAASRKVPLMVGHVMLFHPAIQKIKALVDSGKLGKVQYLYGNRLNLGTVRTEENILWSFAPHDISIFQYLVGMPPVEVVSRGGAFVQSHLHDTTTTILTYPGNVVGHIFVSWLHPFKEHRIVVIGSKGMLSFDDASDDKVILYYEKGIDWVQGAPVKRDGATERIAFAAEQPLECELKAFLSAVETGTVSLADGRNAVEVLEILERATASLMGVPEAPAAQATGAKEFFVHQTAIVDDNVKIGAGTKIWHFSHVQPGARIGEKCSIGQNVNVANNVRIGNYVKIQNNVSVYEGVELEDYVFCGPSMVFTNVLSPRCKYPQHGSEHYSKTLVQEGASLGANCTIVCGTTIGRHAFVAAGAVITKDVPAYALMMGCPARRAGWVCECGERLAEGSSAPRCSRCGLDYRLNGELLELKSGSESVALPVASGAR